MIIHFIRFRTPGKPSSAKEKNMFDSGFEPFSGDARHLTPQEWTALRKCIVGRAHEERNRAIRQMVAGTFGVIWRVWRRIRDRQEARATLGSMTDRELWDIGLSRSGIEVAIRRDDTEEEILRLNIPSTRSNAKHASLGR
jgi:uncharacterized protein YjiS (DUF1127 family)